MSVKLLFVGLLFGFWMTAYVNGQPIILGKLTNNDVIAAGLDRGDIVYDKPDEEITSNDFNLVADEAKAENALFNYLFARQMINRIRERMDMGDLQQHKRSYWKQCAFNAVSCFG